jgi:tetratricopeptide (TPR) repeat protein
VAFSPDGQILWSRDDSGAIKAWNVNNGKPLPNHGQPAPFAGSGARNPSAPLLALPEDDTILLIDLSPPDAEELAFRDGKAQFDPNWHNEQAAEREQNAEWFAAAFHRSLLAENAPWDPGFWESLEDVCVKMGDYQPTRAVCDRLLRQDPTLAPIYLRRSLIRQQGEDLWGGWVDLLRSTYFSVIDHQDWIQFSAVEAQKGQEAADKDDWPQAVRHYTLASAWQPHDAWILHRLAWVRLAAGDEAGYRLVCRRLHVRFGNLEGNRNVLTLAVMLEQGLHPLTPGPLVIERAIEQDAAIRAYVIAVTACLIPESGIDPDTLVNLAASEVSAYPSNATHRAAYGAALYRAGKYEEALKQLKEAIRLEDVDGYNWRKLFLAMAYHRLGQAEKARAWLDKAALAKNANWQQRLLFNRLHQEATALLKTPPKPP